MKKNPSHISEYNYFCQLSTRWNDNDIYGHMNNIIYYALFDTAVNKWLIKNKLIDIKSGQNIGLIVQSGCNYFSSFDILPYMQHVSKPCIDTIICRFSRTVRNIQTKNHIHNFSR